MTHRAFVVIALALVLAAGCTLAPKPRLAPSADSDPVLALDSRIRRGVLGNGLTYYVLPHSRPEKRAQLWLVVNAGSVLEDDRQRGLAHFVEHMAFNGTKKYPKQAIVDFIERAGMVFGADLNAYTSFDETVYTLAVPTDDAALVDAGLDILHEWATAVTFDPQELEKERGVVLEEWRLGRDAWGRVRDKQYPVLMHGSRYAERLPIGLPEIIRTAAREELVRFFDDWYRPDLMAVVAVGDFDAEAIEKDIRSRFASIPSGNTPRARPSFELPAHEKTLVSIVTDEEMPSTSFGIANKTPHRRESTRGDYRRMLVERLYFQMFNGRMRELSQRPDAPFLGAGAGWGGLTRTADSISRSAGVKEGRVEDAMRVVLEEIARVEQHGFTATELERARTGMLRGLRQAAIERDKLEAEGFANEIVRHYLENETMPGIEAEAALAEEMFPAITLEEVNRVGREGAGTNNRVVLLSGPAKTPLPDEATVRRLVDVIEGRSLEAWTDNVPTGPLVSKVPAAGRVVSTREIASAGATEWTLSNGARVVFKVTDFDQEKIEFRAISPGGDSLIPSGEYDDERFSDDVVRESGLGNFDRIALGKALTGKIAGANAWIGDVMEGLSGGCATSDLDTLLQLVHLNFTGTRLDREALAAWRSRMIEHTRNERLDPETAFWQDFDAILSRNDPRFAPLTPEMIEKADLDRAYAFYRERFADAGDFTFIFVGNIDPEKLRPLAETWLATLPSSERVDTWRDSGVDFPKGTSRFDLAKGKESRSQVRIAFGGPAKWSREAETDARALSEVLNVRLREILREDMGGVYGVGVWGGVTRRPGERYFFNVGFGCAPDQVDPLTKAVLDVIEETQKKGVAVSYLEKVRENWKRTREVDLRRNPFWLSVLASSYAFQEDPAKRLDLQSDLARLTSDNIRDAAILYLDTSRYALGILRPGEKKQAGPP